MGLPYAAEHVFFGTDSFQLTDKAKTTLQHMPKAWLRDRKLLIEGHTDKTGSPTYNMALSQKRAEAVRDYLASLGVPQERMFLKARGDTQLIVPGPGPSEFNRNVEITSL